MFWQKIWYFVLAVFIGGMAGIFTMLHLKRPFLGRLGACGILLITIFIIHPWLVSYTENSVFLWVLWGMFLLPVILCFIQWSDWNKTPTKTAIGPEEGT